MSPVVPALCLGPSDAAMDASSRKHSIYVHVSSYPNGHLASFELSRVPVQLLPLSCILAAAQHVDSDLLAMNEQSLVPCFKAGFLAGRIQLLCDQCGIPAERALICSTLSVGDNRCTSVWFGLEDVLFSCSKVIPCESGDNVSACFVWSNHLIEWLAQSRFSCSITLRGDAAQPLSLPIKAEKTFPTSSCMQSEDSEDSDNSMYVESAPEIELRLPEPCKLVKSEALAQSHGYAVHGSSDLEVRAARALREAREHLKKRIKGCTDRGRVCKELRNAVPAHLKKRKNRRAVIKTLKDLQEYMESIDPVLQECGMCPEYCTTAARTIGLSNTRFTELRRMWEAYEHERDSSNSEILELCKDSAACTLRKLVGVLEDYGHSCTSGSGIASPSGSLGSARTASPVPDASARIVQDSKKRPALSEHCSPKKPRSVCASSEDGHTSDEGEWRTSRALLRSLFKRTEPMGEDSEGTSGPDYTDTIQSLQSVCLESEYGIIDGDMDMDLRSFPSLFGSDLGLFDEIEKGILSEFM